MSVRTGANGKGWPPQTARPASRSRRGARGPAGSGVHPGSATILAILFALMAATGVLAASPEPSAVAGDVRTTPAAPGLVGDPLFAVLGVLVIAGAAIVLTLLYIRLSDRR